jgi:hypothetical protein
MDTLFDYNPDDDYGPDEQDALRDAMVSQWDNDLKIIKERGVIPDFFGEPRPLSKDKARLLEYLYDHGYVAWHNYPCQNNRDVTKAIGLNNTGNAKAVIDMCFREGLIESRLYRGEQVFQLAQDGEYALEEHQIEVELGLV